MNEAEPSEPQPGSEWIVGGGEMGRLIRAMDWSHTPLGAIASWPQSLRTTVNLCLASDLPICIIWGPELVQLYNDGYRVICGEKHPRSMGQNFPECWREAWPVIGAAHDSALAGDTAFLENQHIFLERHGYIEECFFTFSFSPIRDETGRLAGLFHPVIEMTPSVLGERRTRTLRDLASGVSNAKSIEEAFTLSAETLSEYPLDLPFLLIYRLDETEQQARLVAATGLAPGTKGAPEIVPLYGPDQAAWPLGDVFRAGEAIPVDDVAARFGKLSAGPFPESIASAVLLPITTPGAERPMAVVIAGFSPRLRPNEMYRVFHDLLSGAMTTAVASAGAYDAERNRAEALANIDRMKTAFFANVSHEFRTPLTLMLSPLEDALDDERAPLVGVQHERLMTAHRNSLRLLKLVNTLLDFSQIEAGRAHANLVATDLAELTVDLAAGFRSAFERAGLRLIVDCPPLPEPAVVDRDMWEKIVLNLLSNAFKFTFEGAIAVQLRPTPDGRAAELVVRDSGVGVPPQEIPRLFERFHRIEGQKSRSFEGSGIGLALVQELVQQHGGTVSAESAVGQGTTFTVTIPFKPANPSPQQAAMEPTGSASATRVEAYVEEALGWLAGGAGEVDGMAQDVRGLPRPADGDAQAHVLLADDNADMRDYLRRLLETRWSVETVGDGEAALEAVRRRKPDLLLTDVMMPRLDGFGLLREVRADPALRDLPVVLLSARAGEDAQVEGLEAGADDYLIKPFSARELLARVAANLALASARRQAVQALANNEARLQQLFNQAPGFICVLRGPKHTFEMVNVAYMQLIGDRDVLGKSIRDALPEAETQGFFELLDGVYNSGEAFIGKRMRIELQRQPGGGLDEHYLDFVYQPIIDPDGGVSGIFVQGHEVTEHLRAEAALRDLNATLEQRVQSATAEREEALVRLHEAQKVEVLGQLTGGVAHDFNNLLTPIMGGIDILARKLAHDERAQRIASAAMQSAERARTLIQRLLSFGRRQTLQSRATDLSTLVEGMRDLIERSIGPSVQITIDVPGDLPAVEADPNQLELAILNLCVNARDAMESGGRLTISAALAERNAGSDQLECVALRVSDTGKGMDAATLAKATEPFFTTKGVGQGTGLGLSMVYGLAAQSGGKLTLTSTVGEGTTAELALPVAPAPAEILPILNTPAIDHGVGTVLLVDDEELVRMSVADGLRDLGYKVVEAASAAGALQHLREGLVPDVLVTDHMMPGMTGAHLAREARGKLPDLPVLMITGYANLRPEETRGLDVMAKPFHRGDLAARIADLMVQPDGKVVRLHSTAKPKLVD